MSEQETPRGGIGNTGYVDLTGFTKPEDFEGITRIYNTGAVLVPETLAAAAAKVPMKNVGQVIRVPTGRRVVVRAGMDEMSGKALENGSVDSGDVMLLIGQTVVTSVPAHVGFELIVAGTLIAPHEAQDVISAAITQLSGQVLFYRGKSFRVFNRPTTLDREYFELLPEPVSLVIDSPVDIEQDVTKEIFREKVSDIVLTEWLIVPKHLKSLAQALATTNAGLVDTDDDDDEELDDDV